MAQSHKPDMFRWKRFTKPGTLENTKVRLTDGDINTWMKKVEMASEFAVSKVFSSQKPHAGKPSRHAVALQNVEQLQDHDDAYSEAQFILNDWMNTKLLLETEMDEEDEEEDEEEEEERTEEQPVDLNYRTFHDMNSQLVAVDESFEVQNFLQDLLETDVMNRDLIQRLCQDADDEKRRGRDPGVTMEIRHKQVKERRAQRDAVRERWRREQEARREALEEVKRLEIEELRKRKQEARRQDELLQQEMVRLRREMQEKRSMEQLARTREREPNKKRNTGRNAVIPKPDPVTQMQTRHKEEHRVVAKCRIFNLQCMQKHFSAWHSVVLEKRVRFGKAAALCEWRRQLRVWRAWRALVWARRKQREAERTEEELRQENRRRQLADKSNQRRLLRRCLSDWRLWCRMERERRELINQQEETRRKMAALIDAAASGKLTTKTCVDPPTTVQSVSGNQSETNAQLAHAPGQRANSAPAPPTPTGRTVVPPTQAWQVTRRHTALSVAEAQEGRRLSGAPRCQSAEIRGGRFEHRHMAQQRTIAEQKRLLKEQQDIINQLQDRRNLLDLRQEAEKVERIAVRLEPSDSQGVIKESHTSNITSCESDTTLPAPKEYDCRLVSRHPAVRAMEERARQRAERRREVEEVKKKREEEKLTQMRDEEEEKVRQEEEEKRLAAERRREERRLKKERELEKQRRTELEQKLFQQAGEHYKRSLLLHRGITPWRQLVKQSHANAQKAAAHHTQVVQRRCLLVWLHTTGHALAEKRRCAEQLYECILRRRVLYGWKMLKDLQSHMEDKAEHFYTTRTQRKVLKALLDYAIDQRLETWDREQQADEHSARRALRKCLAAWRRLPETLQEERQREDRRDRLRRKVAEILPDFRTSSVNSLWSLGTKM